MSEELHRKYRPAQLDFVIGQDPVVRSIQALFDEKKVPHAFLFTGSSGTGKTTIARIIANELGCESNNIIEVDAATNTGVDDMRDLMEGAKYGALGKNRIKFFIIDECHMLSKNAWNSLLKILEEPPAHVYFALCTTEPSKVIDTIETRCHSYNLKEVKSDDIAELIEYVAEEEKIKLPEGGISIIARECMGSPRRALVYLSKCRACKTKKEIMEVLETAIDSEDILSFCRMLASGKGLTWGNVQPYLVMIKEMNVESVRIQIVNYLTACAVKAKSDKEIIRFLNLLDPFSKPYLNQTSMAEFILSIGKVLFEKE